MNYIVDILVVIFLIFMVLYAQRQRTSKYIVIFITCFIPMVMVFVGGSWFYTTIIKFDKIEELFKNLFSSSYYLSGYIATEIFLYLIFVFIFKIIFYLFKNTSLIADVKEAKRKKILVNLILSLVLGYFFSVVLVSALYPLGLTNEESPTIKIYQNSLLIDLNETNALNQNIQIYESVLEIKETLSLDYIDPEFLVKVEEYASNNYQGRRRARVNIFIDKCGDNMAPLNLFVDEQIIKPYLDLIIKRPVVRNVISNIVLEDELFAQLVVQNWAQELGINLESADAYQINQLDHRLHAMQIQEDSAAKLEEYWK